MEKSFRKRSYSDLRGLRRVPGPGGGTSMNTETAVLAGGCFWGVQDLLRKMSGVISTRVGYTGGDVPNATYSNHGTHAEAIEIVFDPGKRSEEHTSELQSLMRISYAVFCLKK